MTLLMNRGLPKSEFFTLKMSIGSLIHEVCRMFAHMKLAFILSLLILTVNASRAVEISFPEMAYWIPDGMKEADEQEVNLTCQGSII